MNQPTMTERPSRPLSAYNIFFQKERQLLMAEHKQRLAAKKYGDSPPSPKQVFGNVAKAIASRWRDAKPQDKKPYEDLAKIEKIKHKKAKSEWQRQRRELAAARREKTPSATQNFLSSNVAIEEAKTTATPTPSATEQEQLCSQVVGPSSVSQPEGRTGHTSVGAVDSCTMSPTPILEFPQPNIEWLEASNTYCQVPAQQQLQSSDERQEQQQQQEEEYQQPNRQQQILPQPFLDAIYNLARQQVARTLQQAHEHVAQTQDQPTNQVAQPQQHYHDEVAQTQQQPNNAFQFDFPDHSLLHQDDDLAADLGDEGVDILLRTFAP